MLRRIRNGQMGFTATEVVIVLCVIVVLCIGGWYVWQNQKVGTKTNNKTFQNDEQADKQQIQTDPYVTIAEWGVRFAVPEDLRGDLSYVMNDRAEKDFGGPLKVDILSKQFSEGAYKCAEIEGDVPRSLVSMYYETDGDGVETNSPKPFKRLGDKRYYFAGQTACEETMNRSGTDADKALLNKVKDSVANTLEHY